MELANLRELVHDKCNELKRLEYLLSSKDFETFYNKATPEIKTLIVAGIKESSLTKVGKLFKEGTSKPLQEMSFRELVVVAKRVGLKYYKNLDKTVLLSELAKYEGEVL
jgi:hypothetical protein